MKPSEVLRKAVSGLDELFFRCQAVNLREYLERQFNNESYGDLKSYELANEWLPRFLELVSGSLEEWRRISVPVPAILDRSSAIAYCGNHSKYTANADGALLPEFKAVVGVLAELTSRRMLGCTALVLHAMGCDPILITDGANDGGVDVVGRVFRGPFAGMLIFGQSKSASSSVSKDTVRLDFTKFTESPDKIREYARAVGVTASGSGSPSTYVFCTNNEFDNAVILYAREKGILLRGRRQIGNLLGNIVRNSEELSAILNSMEGALRPNLNSNIRAVIMRELDKD